MQRFSFSTSLAIVFTLIFAGILTAADKTDGLNQPGFQPSGSTDLVSAFSTESKESIEDALLNHFGEEIATANSNGVDFVTPFFISTCYGVLSFGSAGIESVGFCPELGPGDYSRLNNDGTVSVHVSSNDAEASYSVNFVAVLIGSGHVTINATGMPIEIPLPSGMVIRFIDTANSARGLVWQGNGRARADSTSPWQRIKMWVRQSPSGNSRAGIDVED